MTQRTNTAILLSSLVLGMSSAYADFGTSNFNQSNVYMGAELGVANGLSNEFGSDQTAVMGRLFGGYAFNPNLAAEIGLFGTSNFSQNYGFAGNATDGVSGIDFSGIIHPNLFNLNVDSTINGLYARLGFHYSNETFSSNYDGFNYGNGSASGVGLMYGIGYEFPAISRNLTARVEYIGYSSVAGIGGDSMNTFNVGICYHFN
jgi:hypothetical protein